MPSREEDLHALLDAARAGRLSRRGAMQRLAMLGIGPALGSALLAQAGLVHAQPQPQPQAFSDPFVYRPTRRGGGGLLRMLVWQGPTILNPHLSGGSKDQLAARLFYEPMAIWNRNGQLEPVLAAEIPSFENGGVARDGLSVTWKLKRGVTWHDGNAFDADDLVATWEFARHPETGAFTAGSHRPIQVRKVDSHTVRIQFERPTPEWADAFVEQAVLPRRHFAAFTGAKAREAAANRKPVGTGAYRLVDFRPGDLIRAELNTAYHMPNRPFFDAVELKGGGDSVSAARAVIQTGEYDFAWNIQAEEDVLVRLERGGRGRMDFAPGGDTEYVLLNQADPWTEMHGERAHPESRHPLLSDPAVRAALAHLVDRESIQRYIYGRAGVATTRILNNPAGLNSSRVGPAFDVARANALLDAARWARGSGGIRARDGRAQKLVFQTTVNSPRQKTQTIIKQAASQAGIEMDLKAVSGSVFFSSDLGNPDTNGKFWADLQMYTTTRGSPDAARFMELFCSWLAASKANGWLGRNISRWRSDEYDRTFRTAQNALDPARRAAMLMRLNDLVCADHVVIPIVYRPKASAVANNLQAPISGWAVETNRMHDWYRG
jgi:peptide/nickel transport system substrate-binding protein